ncbi:MAG TPA: hypothetical protein VLX92_07755 [Kofleriaceae bacterium]|nr:hypothetical protein [Kofleriaceae bacterium]
MRTLAFVFAIAACTSSAPAGHVDALEPACTGAIYDPCNTEHDCGANAPTCQNYEASGFQVCTTACTAGNDSTCPTQNGMAATCNDMGLCKPPAANACKLAP